MNAGLSYFYLQYFSRKYYSMLSLVHSIHIDFSQFSSSIILPSSTNSSSSFSHFKFKSVSFSSEKKNYSTRRRGISERWWNKRFVKSKKTEKETVSVLHPRCTQKKRGVCSKKKKKKNSKEWKKRGTCRSHREFSALQGWALVARLFPPLLLGSLSPEKKGEEREKEKDMRKFWRGTVICTCIMG